MAKTTMTTTPKMTATTTTTVKLAPALRKKVLAQMEKWEAGNKKAKECLDQNHLCHLKEGR